MDVHIFSRKRMRNHIAFTFMHLSIASPAPGDPGHGGDHAGTVRERTKNVGRLCRGV